MKRSFLLAAMAAGLVLVPQAALHASATLSCSSGSGQNVMNVNFEDGVDPFSTEWSAFKVTHPATVQTDPNRNKFLRITATPADVTWTGNVVAPTRVRSQASVGGHGYLQGESYTYSFSMRLSDNSPEDTVLWQLFQYGSETAPQYGVTGSGTGPSMWIHGGANGSIGLRNYYNSGNSLQDLDLGTIPTNQFVNMSVSVVWSLDPSQGRIDVWADGSLLGSMTGVPTIFSPLSNDGVDMHIGTYGDGGWGVVDFDNIDISACR